MRIMRIIVLFAASASTAFAQTTPTVTNVRAAQRVDSSRLVDIYYDLSHNAPCTVWPVISGDGGLTWNVPALTLTGDLGHNVAPGTNKHVIWDAGRDIPGVLGSFRARVYADDGQTGSNMVVVPAGLFGNQIFVNTFLIDKYEVTNQRYAEFLNDADPDGNYWNNNMEIRRLGTSPDIYYAVNPGRENHPIRFVSAYDAEAYASWFSAREGRTYRLPTEQEWEKAAAWDPTINKHWTYGFQSDSITCADANWGGGSACPGDVTPVGRYNGTNGTNDAHSFYGCYDMTGNVSEWTSTETSVSTCNPPLQRVTKGASYGTGWNQYLGYYLLTTSATCSRYGDYYCLNCSLGDARGGGTGFRLALDP